MSYLSMTATPEGSAAVFEKAQQRLGKVPNMLRAMTNSPVVAEIYLSINEWLAKGVLDAQIRELIAVAVAEANECDYCRRVHTMKGQKAGLSIQVLKQAHKAQNDDPKIAAVLTFTEETVKARGQNKSTSLEFLKNTGWSDAEITEIVAVVTLNLFPNYFNHLNNTPVDFPEFDR